MEATVETELDRVDTRKGEWSVRAHNNPVTAFADVIGVFIISCGYDQEKAFLYTMMIHASGSAVCYWSNKERCEEVVNDFRKIGVEAEVIEANSGGSHG